MALYLTGLPSAQLALRHKEHTPFLPSSRPAGRPAFLKRREQEVRKGGRLGARLAPGGGEPAGTEGVLKTLGRRQSAMTYRPALRDHAGRQRARAPSGPTRTTAPTIPPASPRVDTARCEGHGVKRVRDPHAPGLCLLGLHTRSSRLRWGAPPRAQGLSGRHTGEDVKPRKGMGGNPRRRRGNEPREGRLEEKTAGRRSTRHPVISGSRLCAFWSTGSSGSRQPPLADSVYYN